MMYKAVVEAYNEFRSYGSYDEVKVFLNSVKDEKDAIEQAKKTIKREIYELTSLIEIPFPTFKKPYTEI